MTNENSHQTHAVTWDYSEHAAHYDRRADYSAEAIQNLVAQTGCKEGSIVADIGAGTGKLTKELLACKLKVFSVEPNDAMRSFGIKNTEGGNVTWSIGTGEHTGLPDQSVEVAFFGSSFNVVNQAAALKEVSRIVRPGGWFACMWNHRVLENPLQQSIEQLIKARIPQYSYGLRREDPRGTIDVSGLFLPAKVIEGDFTSLMSKEDIITAWRSHATLRRQAAEPRIFDEVINEIVSLLDKEREPIHVPYTTRIYFAKLRT